VVTLPQFTAEVVEVTGRAITRVRLRPRPATDPDDED
jgi:putative hemolysin